MPLPVQLLREDHLVCIWRDQPELVAQLARSFAAALDEDAVILALLTRWHRDALVESGLDLDLDAAVARGELVFIDAEEACETFLDSGRVPPARFEAVTQAAVDSATELGRPLHVVGEVVGLLWSAGLVGAAMDLEALWNERALRLGFPLLCLYPASELSHRHSVATDELCCRHAAVLGAFPPGASFARERSFEPLLRSLVDARRFVRDSLRGAPGALVEHAELIVSELASNAMRHAGSGFELLVTRTRRGITLTVSDHLEGADRRARLSRSRHHGLGIVEALSTTLTVDSRPDGTTISSELTLEEAAASPLAVEI